MDANKLHTHSIMNASLCREFVQDVLPNFRERNAHLDIIDTVRRGHHPWLDARYRETPLDAVSLQTYPPTVDTVASACSCCIALLAIAPLSFIQVQRMGTGGWGCLPGAISHGYPYCCTGSMVRMSKWQRERPYGLTPPNAHSVTVLETALTPAFCSNG